MPKSKKDKQGAARFEAYYALQHIVPESEWPTFIKTLATPLPITFRITDATHDGHAAWLEAEAARLGATRLPWYACGASTAWTFAGESRRGLRAARDAARDAALRDFLVSGTTSRNLSRQEAVSMVPALLLGAAPGWAVLDACAAPGNKTAQLLERCGPGGLVVEVPKVVARLRRVDERGLGRERGDDAVAVRRVHVRAHRVRVAVAVAVLAVRVVPAAVVGFVVVEPVAAQLLERAGRARRRVVAGLAAALAAEPPRGRRLDADARGLVRAGVAPVLEQGGRDELARVLQVRQPLVEAEAVRGVGEDPPVVLERGQTLVPRVERAEAVR